MLKDEKKQKITIVSCGPLAITGNIPLFEKIIVQTETGYDLEDGQEFPQQEEYHLCRCGNSKNQPFCDGSHQEISFAGTETASTEKYEDRAELIEGPDLDLLDDHRCAFVRLCHRAEGTAWSLVRKSGDMGSRSEAINAACECPAGRLVAVDKTGKKIEPEYSPSINIIQDPDKGVSAGAFVKGGIMIESSSGFVYETRNRVTLCRCGKSRNKPFCDAAHTSILYS